MGSYVTDKVFERKHTKLKMFIRLTIKYGIGLAVIFGLLYVYAFNKGIDMPMKFVTGNWILFFAICLIGIIVNTAKEKDVIVTVMSKSVDITVGDADAVYQVKDYKGTNFNRNGKRKARYELVFSDSGNDQDNMLYVGLPGIKIKQFKEISDAVMTAKQELSGDAGYEAFEGDTYVRKRSASADLKYIFLMSLVILVPVAAVVFVIFEMLNNKYYIGAVFWGLTLLLLFYIWILKKFICYLFERENGVKPLKSLSFEGSSLKINDVQFLYKEIETLSMTPPYLKDFSRYPRILSVKLYESEKPLKFSLGNRIEPEETEEELAEGCTCTYPALYERIKTGKDTVRKFKI